MTLTDENKPNPELIFILIFAFVYQTSFIYSKTCLSGNQTTCYLLCCHAGFCFVFAISMEGGGGGGGAALVAGCHT